MESIIKFNKRGDIPSFLFTIAVLFAVGISLFVLIHLKSAIYDELDSFLNDSDYQGGEAQDVVQEVITAEIDSRIWDWGFLGIFIGYILALIFTAFSTRISPVFFWLYAIISLIGLFVGTVLANTWQAFVNHPEFSSTLALFPITNALLGTYYPIAITVILAIFLIFLFGKPLGETR